MAAVFLVVDLVPVDLAAGDFFVVVEADLAGDFLVADFVAADLEAVDFDAADLVAADLEAAEVLAAPRVDGAFWAVDRFVVTADLVGDFVAADFVAVDLAAVDFLVVALVAVPDVPADFLAVVVFLPAELPTPATEALPTADFAAAPAALVVAAAALAPAVVARPVAAEAYSRNDFASETTLLNDEPARKRGTEVFLILTFSPVRGLRPVRAPRAAFSKVPKPLMATFSPFPTASVMVSTTASNASDAAFLLPKRPSSASTSCPLFTASPPMNDRRAGARLLARR